MPIVTFSGLASGIDVDAIIKATADARRTAGIPLENRLQFNEKETSALEEFNTKLLSLSDSLKDFLTLSGSAIAKKGVSSNPEIVDALVSSNTIASSTSVTVKQLAKPAVLSFNDRFSSADTPLVPALSGSANIDFTVGSGDSAETYSIEVTSETSLLELAEKISTQTDGRLRGSVINVGTDAAPQYLLLVQGSDLGTEKGTLTATVASELQNSGIFQSYTLDQARDSEIDIPGIGMVTRSSNQISDLLPGITLELRQASDVPVLITVTNDVEATAKKVEFVVEALNDLMRFSAENNLIERVENDEGVTNIFGSLAQSSVDNRAITALRSALSEASSGIEGSTVRIMADLGITIERDGTYKFDRDTFTQAVGKDATAANQVLNKLADSVASVNGIVADYTRYQGQIDLALGSNTKESESLNEKLARIEESIAKESELIRKTFSTLERNISRLNAGADALFSILGGLGTSR